MVASRALVPVVLVAVAVAGLVALFTQQPDPASIGEDFRIDPGASGGSRDTLAQDPSGAGAGAGDAPGGLERLPLDAFRWILETLGLGDSIPQRALPSTEVDNFGGEGGAGEGDPAAPGEPADPDGPDGIPGTGDEPAPGDPGGEDPGPTGAGSSPGEGSGEGSGSEPGSDPEDPGSDPGSGEPTTPGQDGTGDASGPDGASPQGQDTGTPSAGPSPSLPELGFGDLGLQVDPTLLLALLAVPLLLAVLYYARRLRPGGLGGIRLPGMAPLAAGRAEERLVVTPGLDIAFPDIAPDLPLVWGAGDPPLRFRPLASGGQAVELTCDGRPCRAMPTAPGSYLLEVRDAAGRRTQRRLRVVRYEEEVVADFNAFAEAAGIERRDRTAREVVAEAQRRAPDLPHADGLLRAFEAVKYDGAAVRRDQWVRYHRATREAAARVVGGDGGAAAGPAPPGPHAPDAAPF